MKNELQGLKIKASLGLVKINENNQVVTTSVKVAEMFGKEHFNVMNDIKRLEIPDNFRALNFQGSTFQSKNRNGAILPCFEMTFDGFTLLAMGFTGKKAMEFKVKYIRAFRAMEAKLKELTSKPVIVSEHTRALPFGKKEIVLSEKAKQEIGGIVKAVVGAALAESNQPTLFAQEKPQTARDELKAVMREVIREEIADYNLKGGVKATEPHNTAPTANGQPIANWLVGISMAVGSINSIYDQMRKRQVDAVKMLSNQ